LRACAALRASGGPTPSRHCSSGVRSGSSAVAPPATRASIAAAAIDAGLDVLEITLDSESALDQIADVCRARPAAVVGAGTVHTTAQVRDAVGVGARFIVSPMLDEDVVGTAVALGVPAIPGIATTTEMARARALGAPAVKVFPAAQLGGPAFVAAVVGPMRGIPMVPTGGVDETNARAYLDAGAVAVGIGGSLFARGVLALGDAASVATAAARVVAAVAR